MLAGIVMGSFIEKMLAHTDLLRSRLLQEQNLPEHGNRKSKGRLSRELEALRAKQIARWFGACAAHFLGGWGGHFWRASGPKNAIRRSQN